MAPDELMHYGVRGMKWGIRRYQPYPDGKEGKFLGKKQAKRLIKTMNRNAYTMANAKYMLDKTNKRIAKYSYKGKTSKVTLENMDKEFHEKTIAKAKEAINEAIKYLDDAGYTVSSKTKNKMLVDKGRQMLGQVLLGPAGQIALAPRGNVTKYKAKLDPQKQEKKRTDDNEFTNEEKDAIRRKTMTPNSGLMNTSTLNTLKKASSKDFDGDSFTPSQEVRETRVFGKILNPADRKKFNYYTAKIDKAENDYLNIAEDDFTPHDENYMKKYHAAEKKYEDAKTEYRKWRNTVSNRVF